MKLEDVATQAAVGLEGLAPQARAKVETAVRQAVLQTRASEILSFRTEAGEMLTPAPNPSYAKALWCFIRDTPYNGHALESQINPAVMSAVEGALSEVLLSEETLKRLIASPDLSLIDLDAHETARGLTAEELDWLKREMKSVAGLPVSQTIETKVAAVAIEQAGLFMKTAAGATLLKVIGQVVATTSGKIVVMKLLKAAAAKAIVSTAFKAVLVSFVKKAGLIMLIKAALGAAVAAGLPMHRLKGVPPAVLPVVFLGLVGAFLAREIWDMPNKLAKTLPGQIGEKVQEQWGEITQAYVAALAESAMTNLQP